jgi:hypothetical protein
MQREGQVQVSAGFQSYTAPQLAQRFSVAPMMDWTVSATIQASRGGLGHSWRRSRSGVNPGG